MFNQNRGAAKNLLADLTSGKFDALSGDKFRGLWNLADKYRANAANALPRVKKLRVMADAAAKARNATRLGTAIGGAGALGLAGLGYAAGRGSSDT